MEKNSEISDIREKNKDTDHTGFSEQKVDLDVDRRTGQVQMQKRSQTVTKQAIVMSRGTTVADPKVKKKTVTVFQHVKSIFHK